MADAETVGPSNNETAENTANAATTDDAQVSFRNIAAFFCCFLLVFMILVFLCVLSLQSNTTQSSPQNESSSSLFDDQTIPIVTTPSQKKVCSLFSLVLFPRSKPNSRALLPLVDVGSPTGLLR